MAMTGGPWHLPVILDHFRQPVVAMNPIFLPGWSLIFMIDLAASQM